MLFAIKILLALLALYFILGILFGLYFLFIGATKIDPLLAQSKKKLRVLLLPGIIITWPFFFLKLIQNKSS